MKICDPHRAEVQNKIMKSLYANADHEAPVSQRCRAVNEALWATFHNDELPKDEMLTAAALITGFACAVLHDAAIALEEKV